MEPVPQLAPLLDAVARWSREARSEMHLAEGTRKKYAADMTRYAEFAAARGHTEWATVDRATVLGWLDHGEPAPSTRRLRLVAVRTLHASLAERNGLADPSRGVRRPRRAQRVPETLTERELMALARERRIAETMHTEFRRVLRAFRLV